MARTDTLGHFLTDVADSIRAKTGGSSSITASSFDTEIASIPSGGGGAVESKDVNFYDYDGTILYSYTKSELNNLTALPENPTHEGLTSLGWNWTLQEIKDFLVDKSFADIGQLYEPTDGKTKIYVTIDKYTLNPTLTIGLNGTATIDWGDNSTDTITSDNVSTAVNTTHTYSTAGDYIISISSNTDIRVMAGNYTYGSHFFWSGIVNSYENVRYISCVKKVIFGNNIVLYGEYALGFCYNLESVSLPNNTATLGINTCYKCISLKHITIPKQTNYVIAERMFCDCYSLQSVSLSSTTYKFNTNCFNGDSNLSRLCLPNSLTIINSYLVSNCKLELLEMPNNLTSYSMNAFMSLYKLKKIVINNNSSVNFLSGSMYNNYNLKEVIVKGNIGNIYSSAFSSNYNCFKYDFTGCTAVPTLKNVNAFGNINANCKIIVPDDLYNDWISANNWSSISSYIVKESLA